MSKTGKHTVYYLDVAHPIWLGEYGTFEEAEAFVLRCVALHAKRRRLERQHWPAEAVLEDEYQRVDAHTWKGGLYGYRISAYDPERDPAERHLRYLRTFADEQWITDQAEELWEDHRQDATPAA